LERSVPTPPAFVYYSGISGHHSGAYHNWGGAYHRRMIDATQNFGGGTALLGFYNEERLLENDPFYVQITPSRPDEELV
jgi:hypothetical protein